MKEADTIAKLIGGHLELHSTSVSTTRYVASFFDSLVHC